MIPHVYRNLSSSCLIRYTEGVPHLIELTNTALVLVPGSFFLTYYSDVFCSSTKESRNHRTFYRMKWKTPPYLFTWKNKRRQQKPVVNQWCTIINFRDLWNWEEISRHQQNQSKQTKYTSRYIHQYQRNYVYFIIV